MCFVEYYRTLELGANATTRPVPMLCGLWYKIPKNKRNVEINPGIIIFSLALPHLSSALPNLLEAASLLCIGSTDQPRRRANGVGAAVRVD